ncbi:hypothetical protein HDC33_000602 [Sporosarcina sp. JAI121]|nr:hypothetical protein [Sporosarcina sp. JAI121]
MKNVLKGSLIKVVSEPFLFLFIGIMTTNSHILDKQICRTSHTIIFS